MEKSVYDAGISLYECFFAVVKRSDKLVFSSAINLLIIFSTDRFIYWSVKYQKYRISQFPRARTDEIKVLDFSDQHSENLKYS